MQGNAGESILKTTTKTWMNGVKEHMCKKGVSAQMTYDRPEWKRKHVAPTQHNVPTYKRI